MSRFSSTSAYNFRCCCLMVFGCVTWQMSWTYDRYYANSRLRFPQTRRRDTEDPKAAKRFCKKHGIPFPESPPPARS